MQIIGVNYSYVMLLEKGAWSMELQATKRVYKYIRKVNHKLPKKATQNIGFKGQTNKRRNLSSCWVLDIMKWFKRWCV